MTDELKSCPFCGFGAELVLSHGESYPRIICKGCDAEITARYGIENVKNDWNTRPIEDALRIENTQLHALNTIQEKKISLLETASGKDCLCPSCQNTAWNTCPQKQAECNLDMLQCGYAELKAERSALQTLALEAGKTIERLEAENAKLKARVEAAEEMIATLENVSSTYCGAIHFMALSDSTYEKVSDSTELLKQARVAWEALK